MRDLDKFDEDHSFALQRIWFLGDVHGCFDHISSALEAAAVIPDWLVFLGDIDISLTPFKTVLEPAKALCPNLKFAFIHGNHDGKSHAHWEMLHNCAGAMALHGQVLDLGGVRVAGLGGHFQGRVWNPPASPVFLNKKEATNHKSYQWRSGIRYNPKLNAAIYMDDVVALSKQRADILVSHEAPSCHPLGFYELDDLAQSLRVVRSFHGHHHDDRSMEYAKQKHLIGFDAKAVGFCCIKDGLGRIIL